MRRREFLGVLGGVAAVWPIAARGQRRSLPTVGFLYGAPRETNLAYLTDVINGLEAAGFVAGQNVIVEDRWSNGRAESVPALMAELIERRPAVIVAAPTAVALAIKPLTATIPIVFVATDDPVKLGLVASLNRPGGNMTGVNFMLNELGTKRLEMLRDLVPSLSRIGLLLNPTSRPGAASLTDIKLAGQSFGYEFLTRPITSESDVQASFSALVEWKANAAMVIPDGLVFSYRKQLAVQASRAAIPTIYPLRSFVEAGGLVSYGSSSTETFKQMGVTLAALLRARTLPICLWFNRPNLN